MATEARLFSAEGPKCFIDAVGRFEHEVTRLDRSLAIRLAASIPHVRYAPDRLRGDHPDGVIARADGLFAIDGSDYEFFRWTFLHELGHHMCRGDRRWASEKQADRFAEAIALRMVRA